MVNAKTFLEKRYAEDMELEDAIHTALLTLKEGFEGAWAGLAPVCCCSHTPAAAAAATWPHRVLTTATPAPPSPAGELSGDNIEVAVVGEDRKFRVLTPTEVTDYLQEVE